MSPVLCQSGRLRAAGLHLGISALVAALSAGLVFGVWYPYPFDSMVGGLQLFGLVTCVDVTLGPLLTAVVANPLKSKGALARDVFFVALIQLVAFLYGLHVVAIARPVVVSFEIDRFRLVTAVEVEETLLAQAPQGLQRLSWIGPRLIAAVKPSDPDQLLRSIELGMHGIDLSMVPVNWRSYGSASAAAWQRARPVSELLGRYPASQAEVEGFATQAGLASSSLRFLPAVSSQASWVALLAGPDAHIVGYLPLDGFF